MGNNIEELGFSQNPDTCRLHINNFVENATRGYIKDLLKPGTVLPTTSMVAANAAFFKGSWATSFDESETKSKPFHGGQGVKNVEMMKTVGSFRYRKKIKTLQTHINANSTINLTLQGVIIHFPSWNWNTVNLMDLIQCSYSCHMTHPQQLSMISFVMISMKISYKVLFVRDMDRMFKLSYQK